MVPFTITGSIWVLLTCLLYTSTVKNKGMIMKTVMGELKGKADGKVIGAAVDALLN